MTTQNDKNIYLLLSSNVSENNTPSEFTVPLANHVQLQGKYRIGITNMILPIELCNIVKDNDWFAIRETVDESITQRIHTVEFEIVTIPSPSLQYYTSDPDKIITLKEYVRFLNNEGIPQKWRSHIQLAIHASDQADKSSFEPTVYVQYSLKSDHPIHFISEEWKTVLNIPENQLLKNDKVSSFHTLTPTKFTYPFPELQIKFFYSKYTDKTRNKKYLSDPLFIQIPHNRYVNNGEFIHLLNKLLEEEVKNNTIIKWKKPTKIGCTFVLLDNGKVKITTKSATEITFSKRVGKLLGSFSSTRWYKKKYALYISI